MYIGHCKDFGLPIVKASQMLRKKFLDWIKVPISFTAFAAIRSETFDGKVMNAGDRRHPKSFLFPSKQPYSTREKAPISG